MGDNKHLNKLTGRFNDERRLARAIRQGSLNPTDIRITEGRVWDRQDERFRSERDIARRLRDNRIQLNQIVLPPTRFYNNITENFNNRDQANSVYLNQVINKLKTIKEGQKININMNRIINKEKLIKNLAVKSGQTPLIIRLENGSIYTLNEDIIEILQQIINGGVVEYASDSSNIIYEAVVEGEEKITIERLQPNTTPTGKTKKMKPSGKFFPYHHKLLKVDLTRYDIHTHYDKKNHLHHNCLAIALMNAEIPKQKVLNGVVNRIKNGHTPICELKNIALELDITIEVDSDCNKITRYGNGETIVRLNLLEGHYFLQETTPYKAVAIKHYFDIPDIEGWEDIAKYRTGKKNPFEKDKTKPYLTSKQLVKLLIENKDTHLKDLSLEVTQTEMTPYYDMIKNIGSLDYSPYEKKTIEERGRKKTIITGDVKPTEYKEKKEKDYHKIICYDVETLLLKDEDDLTNRNEKAKQFLKENPNSNIQDTFMVCWETMDTEKQNCRFGMNCVKQFLNDLTKDYGVELDKKGGENVGQAPLLLLYAHNGGFDLRFIQPYLWNFELIESGRKLICGTGHYVNKNKYIRLQFRDSYNLIASPLKAFTKMFNIDVEKEYMPYDLYTDTNVYINNEKFTKKEMLDMIPEHKHTDFIRCAEKSEAFITGYFNWNMYSAYYCNLDVRVLKQGILAFRKQLLDEIDIDVFNFFTIPSIAHEYFMRQGCYDDTWSIGGVVREFISRCLVGGRTMMCNNKKQQTIKDTLKTDHKRNCNVIINDFDAVSLYPSAMARMRGFLKGVPKVITDTWEDKDGYFVELEITKINKHRKFPMMSFVDRKTGIRKWTDNIKDYKNVSVFVDRTTLEIWKEYHNIEYKFIRGYYYDEGFNTKINDVIRYVFDKRKELKAQGNPAEQIYKLLMNSGYGKSITKAHDTKVVYKDDDEYQDYLYRYYNWVKEANPIASANSKARWSIKTIDSIDTHQNYAHIGCEILSMSKMIMSEVMYLAEDNNIDMYYTDTDSIHIDDSKVALLNELFTEKYERPLIGSDMGQFHTDFDDWKVNGEKVKDIVSVEFIALGKKCYVDKLRGVDSKGNYHYNYHLRMKGIKDGALKRVIKDKYNNDPIELYKHLYDGNTESFDLTQGIDEDGNDCKLPCMKYHKSWIVETQESFIRELKF